MRAPSPARLGSLAAWSVQLLPLLALTSTDAAQAQRESGAAPFALRLEVDLPVIAASATIGSAWLLRNELAPAACAPRCDRSALAGFDRGVAGRYDADVRLASDLGVAALLAGGAAVVLLDGGWVDFAIASESVLVASAIGVTLMLAVRRPRPWLYGEEAPLADRERGGSSVSFPSGHTANAFALAFALFQIERARHPGSSAPYWLLAGSGAIAAAVGTSRVLAGDHFPSDVIAGALLGSAVGWAVPELHRVAPRLTLAPTAQGLSLAGAF
jgi:membrane-associated phospholipid phosphatase